MGAGVNLFLYLSVNVATILSPTWIVLSSFFALDSSLDPLLLALVGATGATIGRLILKNLSSFFRRFVGKEQKSNLDTVGNFLNRKKFGYVLTSFLFAATPLPSNMLFVAYGMMIEREYLCISGAPFINNEAPSLNLARCIFPLSV